MGLHEQRLKEEAPLPIPEQLSKTLGKLGIDPAFVLATEHRPKAAEVEKNSDSDDAIPVVDLSGLWSKGEDGGGIKRIVEEVGLASEKWGFFQVVNHGVPLELLEELEKEAKEFFALPVEEKSKVYRTSTRPYGYFDTELTKNTRDWKEVFDILVKEKVEVAARFNVELENQWPEGRPEFRNICRKWVRAVEALAYRILELLAMSLGLSSTYFHGFFKEDQTSFVRLNHYRKCPIPDLVLGVNRHKDRGSLTILFQDEVGGLEVKRKRDGEWIRVAPRRDAFVINIGDVMQVWSNDRYESVEHRVVVNENRNRFSCPFFLFPSYDAEISPVPCLTSSQKPPKYMAFNWGEFDITRKTSNFKHLGVENLQISHYSL